MEKEEEEEDSDKIRCIKKVGGCPLSCFHLWHFIYHGAKMKGNYYQSIRSVLINRNQNMIEILFYCFEKNIRNILSF